MNQQRSRRFRSAQEAKEADEKKEEFQKLLKKQNHGKQDQDISEEVIQKTWDSNVITPGTPFMDILAASLRYWIAYKLNTDPSWERVSYTHIPRLVFYVLTSHSLKSSYQMLQFLEKENIKLWNLFDLNAPLRSMIRIRTM